jgi:hypothetical protein
VTVRTASNLAAELVDRNERRHGFDLAAHPLT